MKFLIAVAALSLSAPAAWAADYRFSLTAGVVYGELTWVDTAGHNSSNNVGLGLTGGAELARSLSENFEGEADLLYLQRTWKDYNGTSSYSLSYLSLPLFLRYKLTHGLGLVAGGTVSTPVGNYQGQDPDKAGFGNLNVGYLAGLTVTTDVASNMRLELRYENTLYSSAASTNTSVAKYSEFLLLAAFPIFGH